MKGNWGPQVCLGCGWEPAPSWYRQVACSTMPDWRKDRAVVALLFGLHPELMVSPAPGARIYAALIENA